MAPVGDQNQADQVDLVHGSCSFCSSSLLHKPEEDSLKSRVFVLSGKTSCEVAGGAHALEGASVTERVVAFKKRVDELGATRVTVHTSERGRALLARLQRLLFTSLYTFDYRLCDVTCPCGSDSVDAAAVSPDDVEEEVKTYLQSLPPLRGGISVLTSSLIPDAFGHGFSTRCGGISDIPTLSSLNLFCSSKRRDPIAVVTENRRRLAVAGGFHPKLLRMVKVNHANDVWVLNKSEPESYDAMVTNQRGVVLAAPGADCMPILFADPVKKVIGAAHAGWKGTLMGVAMATVDAMQSEYGCCTSDILVVVGPSVGACCFTLDQQEALDFINIHPDCVPDPESAKPHVNIRLANRLLLQKGGILPEHIHDDTSTGRPCVTLCTSCHPQLFFSHVRDGVNFGTQIGFLWIKEMEEVQTVPPAGETKK